MAQHSLSVGRPWITQPSVLRPLGLAAGGGVLLLLGITGIFSGWQSFVFLVVIGIIWHAAAAVFMTSMMMATTSSVSVTEAAFLRERDLRLAAETALFDLQRQLPVEPGFSEFESKRAMAVDIRRGLANNEFALHYQPIVSLATGDIRELEALVRWQHPTRGLVAPMEFIPVAEESGLILPLGRWVLAEACHQAKVWQTIHPSQAGLVMSVNLSARQIQEPGFVNDVATILQETGLSPSNLKLEITESVMMHDTHITIDALRQIRELGVSIAIDDFGTGYSSLSYLQRFPVDSLKIDRSFVMRLGNSMEDQAIIQSIITLARTLSLSVTGEGIETTDQMEQLQALGCDRGQGYHFARPATAAGIDAILAGCA